MKVIITGAAGRMGATLVRLALEDPELTLAGATERATNLDKLAALDCVKAEEIETVFRACPGAVAVDFTAPAASLAMARTAARTGNPAVIGTTGLKQPEFEELRELALKTPLLWAPNMSVGVNTLLKVLPTLVQLLGPNYDMEMTEIHHNKKADAPSGTALKLAQCLAEARGWVYDEVKTHCRDGIVGARRKDELGVQTVRGGDVVGDHTIYFLGPGERIEVTHRAHSRETFAQGALRAAKWLGVQKPGRLYSMADVLA